jgi:hypothetical protein
MRQLDAAAATRQLSQIAYEAALQSSSGVGRGPDSRAARLDSGFRRNDEVDRRFLHSRGMTNRRSCLMLSRSKLSRPCLSIYSLRITPFAVTYQTTDVERRALSNGAIE